MNASLALPPGVGVLGERLFDDDDVLTREALAFVAGLARRFQDRLDILMVERRARQARLDAGEPLGFLPETRDLRESSWTVAPIPAGLEDRRVEITGPTDRKMIINALNSGANVYMADFEDSNCPTWDNLITGQKNLMDAVRRQIRYEAPDTGKVYELKPTTAALFVRPRGLHLPEPRVEVDGRAIPGCLLDFGLYAWHNARHLAQQGLTPAFYLPKMESHREAAWWDEVLEATEQVLGLPIGTLRATVLIETLPAAFEMHEILWALRRHSLGLNCGRWDYIFSFIKKRRADAGAVVPDRGELKMSQPFLRDYTRLLIQTCHRRGAHAMGGMSALIPVREDPSANEAALEGVRADKLREVVEGHDGTWVAHPGLVPLAKAIFDEHLPTPNQVHVLREDVDVGAAELLAVPQGHRTLAGLRQNVEVGIQYLEAWLRGLGCVPIDHLMEDAATAEISRAQVWQWQHHRVSLDDGTPVTPELVRSEVGAALDRARQRLGEDRYAGSRLEDAGALFLRVATAEPLVDFLTLPAFEMLCRESS